MTSTSSRRAVETNADDLRATERAQRTASDPTASCWVNANAGTGKTYVLTERVIRLMLNGTPAERILCLTFTKTAAAEMSTRIFERLAGWVCLAEDKLETELKKLIDGNVTTNTIADARTLFTAAIETPGGLKVQTIHAFCERLLQRFPIEAGLPPGFKVLDDGQGRELIAASLDATLSDATSGTDTSLANALQTIIRYASDSTFDTLLTKAMQWSNAPTDTTPSNVALMTAKLRNAFQLTPGDTTDTLLAAKANVLTEAQIADIVTELSASSKSFQELADSLRQSQQAKTPAHRAAALEAFFLTDSGGKRANLLSSDIKKSRPDLEQVARDAQDRFAELQDKRKSLAVVEASLALNVLSARLRAHYEDSKAAAGALDFDDLIARTKRLLTEQSTADWVLFKLDGGLDHILVDEAQDTSPEQWSIVTALAQEFFSGGGAREEPRSVFAVGDLKQSIYSFQGAAPEMFAAMGERLKALASAAGQRLATVPLNLSFRTVAPVLSAVDAVFAAAPLAEIGAGVGNVTHTVARRGQAGHVEIWTVIKAEKTDASDPFDPLADTLSKAPANQLADRIAETILQWRNTGECLLSEDRAITPGDILILVRKRHPFVVPMVAALKARGIPVAGTDRMVLIEQIAAQDLAVLGDFLTLPEDDLALATVLKSPLFGYTDDDLTEIAPHRKGALWKALLEAARTQSKWQPAAETLRKWRAKADFQPPFEFFSHVLDRDGGRAKMLHRLGAEAADVIDEFLETALAYDDKHPPSLAGFLAHLRSDQREIKRDMNIRRDEVRVMTVHAAKGLEAPIVFLPDTCTTSSGDSNASRLHELPNDPSLPPLWQIKGASKLGPLQDAATHQRHLDDLERNRLLYVAMTRARDRLYVAGFESERGRSPGCWYDTVRNALEPIMQASGDRLVLASAQQSPPEKPKDQRAKAIEPQPLPPFAIVRAKAEHQLSVPLAPSRLEPYAPDEDGEPLSSPATDPTIARDTPSPLTQQSAGGGDRFLRGTLTHALLQYLPALPPDERDTAMTAFLKERGSALSRKASKSIATEVTNILDDERFAPLFSQTSRAEVGIAANIPRPPKVRPGPGLRLSGQIDRLVVTPDSVIIVDYKTNRPPPMEVSNVADAYVLQLAAYVLALREIYPEKRIESALLWTYGPRLMPIPESVIDAAINRLWDLDLGSLDAA